MRVTGTRRAMPYLPSLTSPTPRRFGQAGGKATALREMSAPRYSPGTRRAGLRNSRHERRVMATGSAMKAPSKTALFNAVKLWDVAAVEALLAVSSDLAQATDSKGRTALHLASGVKPGDRALGERDGLRTIAALLKAGAGLEAEAPMDADEGDFRATPLWHAVARGENLPLAWFLLRRGADPSYCLWALSGETTMGSAANC